MFKVLSRPHLLNDFRFCSVTFGCQCVFWNLYLCVSSLYVAVFLSVFPCVCLSLFALMFVSVCFNVCLSLFVFMFLRVGSSFSNEESWLGTDCRFYLPPPANVPLTPALHPAAQSGHKLRAKKRKLLRLLLFPSALLIGLQSYIKYLLSASACLEPLQLQLVCGQLSH